MSNSITAQKHLLWISNNTGSIIKVLILLATIVTVLINPGVVLAQPVMGGSVG